MGRPKNTKDGPSRDIITFAILRTPGPRKRCGYMSRRCCGVETGNTVRPADGGQDKAVKVGARHRRMQVQCESMQQEQQPQTRGGAVSTRLHTHAAHRALKRAAYPTDSPCGRYQGVPTSGRAPMRLRCHAFPRILQFVMRQPIIRRMWTNSCSATQGTPTSWRNVGGAAQSSCRQIH